MKRSLVVQAIVLVVTSLFLALAANAIAGRDRKLVLPGYYPDALKVPKATVPSVAAEGGGAPLKPVEPVSLPAPEPITDTIAVAKPAKPKPKPAPAVDIAKQFPPHPDKAYVEVSGADAAQLHAQGALTLDARRTSVYEQGHISGARPFSVWESDIDDKVNKLYEERSDPREQLKPILIYCSGGDCEDSHMLAQKLWGVQFNNIYVYKDGFPDWQKRGGSVRTGNNP